MRGWDELDVILFSGDAYVDHPSFGAAVIGRMLEAQGLKVAIVPQPNWRDDLRDFKKLGRPRLFFGVSPGCMDSMVNKYTANKRLRSEDAYTPDGRHDMRPEYPSIVYTKILKELFPDMPERQEKASRELQTYRRRIKQVCSTTHLSGGRESGGSGKSALSTYDTRRA